VPDWLRFLLRFALTAVGTVLATMVVAPLLIVISLFTSGGPAYRLARVWCWLVATAMGVTSSLHCREKMVAGASYIVTPNHQSNADILALFSRLPCRFRWVIKKELLNIPLFGWALARTGAISLDRSNREQAVKSLEAAVDKLKDGWSVLIYPEGTRSPDGQLLSFKKGAFMMAVHTGIPILPVTCNGAHKIMPKKTLRIYPGHVTVTVGDPIVTAGLTEDDVPELMERTRQAISQNLDPAYDPFAPRQS
jgi:1-acyl-sn-glycerol-3-phosphate acyltransferase